MSIISSCKKKQTFCDINGQLVSDQPDLNYTTSTCLSQQKITTFQFQELINKLVSIYNYGQRGTRNPINTFNLNLKAQTEITAEGEESAPSDIIDTNDISNILKSSGETITANDYNKILTAISIDPKIIGSALGTTFADTIISINNYQINADRCDNCNLNCNTYGQNYCDCDCNCDCDCDCYCDCCGGMGEYCCGYD